MEELAPATMVAPGHGRRIAYAPEIHGLLAREEKIFRIDSATVGVSDFHLISAAVAARPVLVSERSVFKPAAGTDIHHDSATRTIRALGRDVMTGIQAPPPPAHRLSGAWPHAATSYLREWLFSSDPLPISLLSKHGVTRFGTLSRVADRAATAWPGADTHARRQAIALYRRATATLSDGVAALTANALWLMNSAHREEEPQSDLVPMLWETLRLLPPAWMLLRTGGGRVHRAPLQHPSRGQHLALPAPDASRSGILVRPAGIPTGAMDRSGRSGEHTRVHAVRIRRCPLLGQAPCRASGRTPAGHRPRKPAHHSRQAARDAHSSASPAFGPVQSGNHGVSQHHETLSAMSTGPFSLLESR